MAESQQPAVHLSRLQSRQIDQLAIQEYGMLGLVLMENAGRGVAECLLRQRPDGPVLIACGKGNNGGDGFVIARHLDLHGIQVRVMVWAELDQLAPDAAANFKILEKCGLPLDGMGSRHDARRLADRLRGCSWIVDALLGTGARGDPAAPLDAVIDQLNASSVPKLAVDLPSGLDCDTGWAATHTIRARITCTFVAPKIGFLSPQAQKYLGQVEVVEIGAPREILARVFDAR